MLSILIGLFVGIFLYAFNTNDRVFLLTMSCLFGFITSLMFSNYGEHHFTTISVSNVQRVDDKYFTFVDENGMSKVVGVDEVYVSSGNSGTYTYDEPVCNSLFAAPWYCKADPGILVISKSDLGQGE